MDFSNLTDQCLYGNTQLNTSLGQITGENVIYLYKCMNGPSMHQANVPIIKRVLLQIPTIFNTLESIEKVMREDNPTIKAFAILGKSGIHCNVRWLILTLNKLGEKAPLRYLILTAPPYIRLRSPTTIAPGQCIEIEVHTISEAHIQWWKSHKGKEEVVLDHIRIQSFNEAILKFPTTVSDIGYYYIEVVCHGNFRNKSQPVYVGNKVPEENEEQREIKNEVGLDQFTDTAKVESTFNEPESSEFIVPSPESDGIKRVALLIGIMEYEPKAPNLKAPETDLLNLERVLLAIGFTTYCFGDLTAIQMRTVLEQFSKNCTSENCYVFFYFAGHGCSEKGIDFVVLPDINIKVFEVLKILNKKKPKVLISIFDMCRDDDSEYPDGCTLQEANIPMASNLILVMSTLPRERAWERPGKYESTSLIMKPLCTSLSELACKISFSGVLTRFQALFKENEQKPVITMVGIPEIIGVKKIINRFKPSIERLDLLVKHDLFGNITVDFQIFHNYLHITVDPKLISKCSKCFIQRPLHNNSEIKFDEKTTFVKINLFKEMEMLTKKKGLLFDFCVIKDVGDPILFKLKVNVPQSIIQCLQSG